MDGKGACGSYAGVLTRTLQRSGVPSRLAQMKCGDQWGCHIVLEANINGEYAVLGPLYNTSFISQDGTLASFKEVENNWNHYKSQTLEGCQYEDVRYTNWQKIPIVMPLIKTVLNTLIGENIVHLADQHKAWLAVCLLSSLFCLFIAYLLPPRYLHYFLGRSNHKQALRVITTPQKMRDAR